MIADVQAWRAARDDGAVDAALDELRRGGGDGDERHAAVDRPGHGRRHHRRVGRGAARGVRRVPGADRRRRGRRSARRRPAPTWPSGCAADRRAGRRGSSWPSPASTVTPTAPSRSPWPPATPAWRSSTRASASRPSRSRRRPATRTSTSIGLSILSGSHLELVPEVVALLRGDGRRRAGRRRRDHPRGRPAAAARPRASPPSTRRRTSSCRGSWTTSPTSSRSDEWADRPRGCVLDSSQHAPMVLR